MANWGTPDFDTNEVIDYEALHARIKAEGGITEWPYQMQLGYSPRAVQKYCVMDPLWQVTRLKMKGLPTHKKLEVLLDWYRRDFNDPNPCAELKTSTEVQVGNYLGALRRGGQLDANNRVRKYL